jgi:two-component system, NarL family, nitrate/nitrite response regulator NarL
MRNIKIIIADDHTLFISGLQSLLNEVPEVEIIDVANSGKELLDLLQKKKTDMVLLDINMPQMNGLEAARYIKQSYPAIKLIILSTYNEDHLIEKAKQLGVNGYLLKNSSKDELLQTINLVMDNHTCFPYQQPKDPDAFGKEDSFLKQFDLTKREREIIQLLKTGYTNQQIADKLYLSVYTVETHRKNIMHKLNFNNAASLLKYIYEHNL